MSACMASNGSAVVKNELHRCQRILSWPIKESHYFREGTEENNDIVSQDHKYIYILWLI